MNWLQYKSFWFVSCCYYLAKQVKLWRHNKESINLLFCCQSILCVQTQQMQYYSFFCLANDILLYKSWKIFESPLMFLPGLLRPYTKHLRFKLDSFDEWSLWNQEAATDGPTWLYRYSWVSNQANTRPRALAVPLAHPIATLLVVH